MRLTIEQPQEVWKRLVDPILENIRETIDEGTSLDYMEGFRGGIMAAVLGCVLVSFPHRPGVLLLDETNYCDLHEFLNDEWENAVSSRVPTMLRFGQDEFYREQGIVQFLSDARWFPGQSFDIIRLNDDSDGSPSLYFLFPW